ncbi:Calcineurin-like phosphoesterase [Phytophthora infestans]|uniref:Serine/threonine-protein phosphatase n=1 Tax=Phytophthora infestans TaxID=4787 RepID=A0A833T4Y7_PHYIN|nr:Calcineurin-like phosphoesterase [Phytophthora infestans]
MCKVLIHVALRLYRSQVALPQWTPLLLRRDGWRSSTSNVETSTWHHDATAKDLVKNDEEYEDDETRTCIKMQLTVLAIGTDSVLETSGKLRVSRAFRLALRPIWVPNSNHMVYFTFLHHCRCGTLHRVRLPLQGYYDEGTRVLVYGILIGRVVQVSLSEGIELLYSDAVLSANRIKNAIRQHLAYLVYRTRLNFSTWNMLEAMQEQRTMQMMRFVKKSMSINELHSMMPLLGRRNTLDGVVLEKERVKALLTHYRGVRVLFPLRLITVKRLINQFRNGILLHPVFVCRILDEVEKLFLTQHESPMNAIDIPPGVRMVVVGDLHGQLEDLLTIMEKNGAPSSKTWYLFNGDFVDRGAHGVEIMLLLLAFKLMYPAFVFLNRGNHEERMINEIFGFQAEVYAKYGNGWSGLGSSANYSAPKLFQLFETVFNLFPVFALVNRCIFVVHGGLSSHKNVTIEELLQLDHRGEPTQGTSRVDELLTHLLWSDPCEEEGWKPSSRGAGVEFGPDITKAFCKRNGISLIIRSHECREEGFDIVHDGLLLTVFSASNYCGSQTNKGAYVLLERGDNNAIQPRVAQFSSQPLQQLKAAGRNEWREKARRLEQQTLESLLQIICENQNALLFSFQQADTTRCGCIPKTAWKAILQRVLGIQANFLSYFHQLAAESDKGGVDYEAFLSKSHYALKVSAAEVNGVL